MKLRNEEKSAERAIFLEFVNEGTLLERFLVFGYCVHEDFVVFYVENAQGQEDYIPIHIPEQMVLQLELFSETSKDKNKKIDGFLFFIFDMDGTAESLGIEPKIFWKNMDEHLIKRGYT